MNDESLACLEYLRKCMYRNRMEKGEGDCFISMKNFTLKSI